MKLNNKGWGLGFFLIVGAIFLLILIIVSFKINAFIKKNREDNKNNNSSTSAKAKETDNSLYRALEGQLEEAGETYIIYHDTLLEYTDDHVIVSYATLKNEGHISRLNDPNSDNECNGFVMIKTDSEIKPFIKCKDYTTLNYDLWVDEE